MKRFVGRPTLLLFVAAAAVIAALVGRAGAGPVSASNPGPAGAVRASVQTGHIGPGTHVKVQVSSHPFKPTAAQKAARQAAMAGLAKHVAPSMGRHTTTANVPKVGDPGPPTDVGGKQAATDLTVMKQSLINSICAGCGQSAVNEPDVANDGKYIVETSNWNIAWSKTGANGATPWLNQNPYALSSGFCCDQQIAYDPGRNIFLLLQLDYAGEGAATNGFTLSIASGTTPTSWCTYKFPGAIGGGATDTPDYPKIGLANNNAYVTWNDYPPNAGWARTGLARFPLDALASCAGFNYNFLTRNDDFTFALSQTPSSLDQFYWVSNWYTDGSHTNGSNLRIFWWPENSGSYFAADRAINPYTFGTVACGSPDWCSRLDPRWETVTISRAEFRAQANAAFSGDAFLEVTTDAGPSGFSGGKNYVVYNYFKLNSLAYIGNDQTYSTGTNFAYPACGANSDGHIGCAMLTGTNAPGGLILLQDDVSPTQPWAYSFTPGAVSGQSAGGDYVSVDAFNPAVGPFETVLWRTNGSTVEPFYTVFGRGRDLAGYKRWAKK